MAATDPVLAHLVDTASRHWGPGRRWTPGEIVWAYLTATDAPDVLAFDGGWCWRQDDIVALLATDPDTVADAIAWAGDTPIQTAESDHLLEEELLARGYAPQQHVPFELDLRLTTAGALPPVVPDGYHPRRAQQGDDLVGVHRASWLPSALPFAPGAAPSIDPGTTSSFTEAVLARVAAHPLYRRDLHLVVEASDGTLAASCIVWLDPAMATASIEPLGVRPDHRRLGLAGALCGLAAQLVHDAGGDELVIHPRGDDAYPAPRAAYLRAGFTSVGRTRTWVQVGAQPSGATMSSQLRTNSPKHRHQR